MPGLVSLVSGTKITDLAVAVVSFVREKISENMTARLAGPYFCISPFRFSWV